jgi:DNA primase
MWDALPAGTLRDQLLGEIAERARLPREDLARRWGVGPKPSARLAGPPRTSVPRVATRRPQDRVAEILLRRCALWHELTADDHAYLVGLEGWHAELFRWLDAWTAEHGDAEWPQLREHVATQAWAAEALSLLDAGLVALEADVDSLRTALQQSRRGDWFRRAPV